VLLLLLLLLLALLLALLVLALRLAHGRLHVRGLDAGLWAEQQRALAIAGLLPAPGTHAAPG
jgi:hypothetical protein